MTTIVNNVRGQIIRKWFGNIDMPKDSFYGSYEPKHYDAGKFHVFIDFDSPEFNEFKTIERDKS